MIDLDESLYIKLRDLVHAQTGMFFDERKRYFVARRIEQRIEEVGATSALDYYRLLRYGGGTDELQTLSESLTTNETYFFREYPQLKAFAEHCLPEILDRKRQRGGSQLRLWCAGCSTGEEPYTLAIILREMIEDFAHWNVSIIASDISQGVLRSARRAVYSERSLKDVPTVYRQRYFQEVGDNYRVLPAIISMVQFRHANLMGGQLPNELKDQDFVFCRNVLIYFDDAARRVVLDRFYDALQPGGYIFLGHSESVGRFTSAFRLMRKGDQLVYVK